MTYSSSIPYQGIYVAGVDEAGRGALAGDVIAAAVILNPKKPIENLDTPTPRRRATLKWPNSWNVTKMNTATRNQPTFSTTAIISTPRLSAAMKWRLRLTCFGGSHEPVDPDEL